MDRIPSIPGSQSPNQRKQQQQQQIMESSPSTGGFVFCIRGMEIEITTSRITPTLRSLFEARYTTINQSTSKRYEQKKQTSGRHPPNPLTCLLVSLKSGVVT